MNGGSLRIEAVMRLGWLDDAVLIEPEALAGALGDGDAVHPTSTNSIASGQKRAWTCIGITALWSSANCVGRLWKANLGAVLRALPRIEIEDRRIFLLVLDLVRHGLRRVPIPVQRTKAERGVARVGRTGVEVLMVLIGFR